MVRIAGAQTYPTRPVQLLVGFAAGGPLDTSARLIAQWLSERLGQQFINENCGRVEKEYRMLNTTLPATLEKVGIAYLYTDYLKDWTAKEGVPLPLP